MGGSESNTLERIQVYSLWATVWMDMVEESVCTLCDFWTAPGLEFITLDSQYALQSSKVPEKRQAIFAQTKRKRKNVEHKEMEQEEDGHSEMDDETRSGMAGIDEAFRSQLSVDSVERQHSDLSQVDVHEAVQRRGTVAYHGGVSGSPRSRAMSQQRGTAAMYANTQPFRPSVTRPSQSVGPQDVSTRSVYAIPDELSACTLRERGRTGDHCLF